MTENVYSPSAFENNIDWTGPEYAYSSNNLYASASDKGATVTYRDYGITSVLGEEPSKVEVGIEAYGDGDDYVEVQVSWDGGVSWTSLVGHVPPTTDPDVPTYLDVTNGRTWTWDELSNANFRVRIYKRTTAKGADINLDWIPVRVTSAPAIVETIVAKDFPMTYLLKPVTAKELRSKVELPIFGSPLARSPSDKLREVNRRWRKGEFINGLDPNFGYEEIGSSGYAISGNHMRGSKATCPEAGVGQKMFAYAHASSGTTMDSKCALYKASDSSKVAETSEVTLSDVYQWWEFPFPSPPTLEPIEYVLEIGTRTDGGMKADKETNIGKFQDITYPTFPDPASFTTDSYLWSIYCSYTPAAPPPAVTIVAKDFPMTLLKKGKAKELRSKWS